MIVLAQDAYTKEAKGRPAYPNIPINQVLRKMVHTLYVLMVVGGESQEGVRLLHMHAMVYGTISLFA
jgi:hypothetical protein